MRSCTLIPASLLGGLRQDDSDEGEACCERDFTKEAVSSMSVVLPIAVSRAVIICKGADILLCVVAFFPVCVIPVRALFGCQGSFH